MRLQRIKGNQAEGFFSGKFNPPAFAKNNTVTFPLNTTFPYFKIISKRLTPHHFAIIHLMLV